MVRGDVGSGEGIRRRGGCKRKARRRPLWSTCVKPSPHGDGIDPAYSCKKQRLQSEVSISNVYGLSEEFMRP